MKTLFIFCFIIVGFIGNSQPKILDHAIIITKVELRKSDGEMDEKNGNAFSGGSTTVIKTVNGMTEGDNRIVTYYKDDKIKVTNNFNMGTNTIIIDKKNKKTVTLIEIMGMKTGFYSTEENVKQMQQLKDSLIKKPFNSFQLKDNKSQEIFSVDSVGECVEYINESKTIAGYDCKKALIKTSHYNGAVDTMYVWYCPNFKLKEGFNIPTGIAGTLGLVGLELLNGFPMKYQLINIHGDKVSIEVKKIDINKEIKDKEFEVPNGYDLKPINKFSGPYQTKVTQ